MCGGSDMRGQVCRLTVPRLLKWGLIVPLMLLPVALLGQREWWQNLVLLVGSYVVLVLGTIAGWRLTDLAEKSGVRLSLAVRACVGMALFCAIFTLGWIAVPPTDREIPHPLADWRVLLLAVAFGVCYAIPPSRWGKRASNRGIIGTDKS